MYIDYLTEFEKEGTAGYSAVTTKLPVSIFYYTKDLKFL